MLTYATHTHTHTQHRIFITACKPFYEQYYDKFSGDYSEEHKLEWTEIHKKFEKIVDEKFSIFAKEEGFENVSEMFERVKNVASESRSAKFIKKTIKATDYKFFVKHMHRKSKEIRARKKKEEEERKERERLELEDEDEEDELIGGK